MVALTSLVRVSEYVPTHVPRGQTFSPGENPVWYGLIISSNTRHGYVELLERPRSWKENSCKEEDVVVVIISSNDITDDANTLRVDAILRGNTGMEKAVQHFSGVNYKDVVTNYGIRLSAFTGLMT